MKLKRLRVIMSAITEFYWEGAGWIWKKFYGSLWRESRWELMSDKETRTHWLKITGPKSMPRRPQCKAPARPKRQQTREHFKEVRNVSSISFSLQYLRPISRPENSFWGYQIIFCLNKPAVSVHCCSFAAALCLKSFVTPWTVALQAPLSVGFPRQNTGGGTKLKRI